MPLLQGRGEGETGLSAAASLRGQPPGALVLINWQDGEASTAPAQSLPLQNEVAKMAASVPFFVVAKPSERCVQQRHMCPAATRGGVRALCLLFKTHAREHETLHLTHWHCTDCPIVYYHVHGKFIV